MVILMILMISLLCIVYAIATSNRLKLLRIKIQEAQADIEVALERLLAIKATYGRFGVGISGGEIAIALCSGYYLFESPQRYQEIENISVERSNIGMG